MDDDALRRALLDTDEKERAYVHSAEFHAVVHVLVDALPELLASLASLGILTEQERRHRSQELAEKPIVNQNGNNVLASPRVGEGDDSGMAV